MEKIILLSATVNANDDGLTKILNPEIRLKQYIKAVHFYLNNTSVKIILVENSNFDFKTILDYAHWRNRLEILFFYGNDYELERGKGFGEMNIIEFALNNSQIIQDIDNCFIFKITGRLILTNVGDFFKQADSLTYPNDYIISDLRQNLSFADSRLFGATINFFKNYLLKYKIVINDSEGIYFEHALAKSILKAISENYIYEPMYNYPNFIGLSATNGLNYRKKILMRFLKNKMRNFKYYVLSR